MSLLAACVVAALAASAGVVVATRAAAAGSRRASRPGVEGSGPTELRAVGPVEDPFVGLPIALGDVVSVGGEERWLAGGLVLREGGRVVAAVLTAPEGATVQAVAVFAPPERAVWWLVPVDLEAPPDPPATIELRGLALRRRRRLPVEVDRLGQGAPSVAEGALFATYEGGGRDVAVVIVAGGVAHAWVGQRRDEGEYDRLGAGGSG